MSGAFDGPQERLLGTFWYVNLARAPIAGVRPRSRPNLFVVGPVQSWGCQSFGTVLAPDYCAHFCAHLVHRWGSIGFDLFDLTY